jgi:LytS/YehU family sensor histidine kinase
MSLTNEAKTPDTILQLAELMRYVIYRCKEETVTVAEEIRYLRDYLELQSIRIHRQLDFQFREEVADSSLRLPPLLLIILVENAFKHGIEPAEGDCFLHLHFSATEKEIRFRCHNSCPPEQDNPPTTGMGLSNLRRRLELRFADRHQLSVQLTPEDCIATLILQI